MEKTNELNKFLSYIHMGNATFRIYYEKAIKLQDDKLINIIEQIEEIFKTHEEKITSLIDSYHEIPTKSITFVGKMALCMEKMKNLNTGFNICYHAIKAVNAGQASALKFLHENKNLKENIRRAIIEIVDDYVRIIKILNRYIIDKNNSVD